jgi:hypothetical protein
MRSFLISHLAKYYEDGQIKEGERKRAYSTYRRSAYKILVGRPERTRLVGRPSRRWGNNIKI